jgi:hypothetical protein
VNYPKPEEGDLSEQTYASQGYILFDVLLALFLFSLGFSVLFNLTESSLSESRQASALMEGANLAQTKLDQLAVHTWSDNITRQACIPGGVVEGNEGKYHWLIRSDFDDIPQLLRVSVEVRWSDERKPSSYKVESLYGLD